MKLNGRVFFLSTRNSAGGAFRVRFYEYGVIDLLRLNEKRALGKKVQIVWGHESGFHLLYSLRRFSITLEVSSLIVARDHP